MKSSVFIATSIDGFIARSDGGIDWLTPFEGENAAGEDYGFRDFIASVDFLVMGRNTYDLVSGFEPWPYAGTPVVVLSSRELNIPASLVGEVERMSGPVTQVIQDLEQRGAQHLYIDGGKTIQAFLAAGLIQQMIITRIPVLIGTGIPLFGPLAHDLRLKHLQTHSYPNGLVQSRYQVLETHP
jgi:dihydrofolate reductase